MKLSISQNCLVILDGDGNAKRIPAKDIAVVVASHPQISYTQSVLSQLADAGAVFVSCDKTRMPNGMFLPLAANSTQAERFQDQANAPLPLRKRLWREIVKSKIESQALALEYLTGHDEGMRLLKQRVSSGDKTNVEATAAKRYWSHLFGSRGFRRRVDAMDENQHLNYGYAVLRAIVARAICASGLHPTLGLHHHNKYNPFCLADDLMEPLRPLVDVAVSKIVTPTTFLGTDDKRKIVAALTSKLSFSGESREMFDCVALMASSLSQVFAGKRKDLALPNLTFHESN